MEETSSLSTFSTFPGTGESLEGFVLPGFSGTSFVLLCQRDRKIYRLFFLWLFITQVVTENNSSHECPTAINVTRNELLKKYDVSLFKTL